MGDHHPDGPGRPLRADHRLPLEKWFRDAKIYQLFEGTAQVQRLVISRMQAREYAEKLAAAAEIVKEAVGGTAAATATTEAPGKEPAAVA